MKSADFIIIDEKVYSAKIAITAEEQARGLMKAYNPPIMAFPFTSSKIRKFWMKDTPAALDIVFCSAGKVVAIEKGKPYSEDLVGPNRPIDLVVEFPYGTCKEKGIAVGSNIKTKYNLITLAKSFEVFLKEINY